MRYDWTVEIAGDDISQWVKAGGTIDYGRRTRATAFQSPTAIFDVFTRDENPNPAPAPGTWPVVRIGDPVLIHVTYDGFTQSRRFSGIVQALDYGLYGLRVTATGALIDGPDAPMTGPYFGSADWQYRNAGETGPITNYPAAADQTETDRIAWLCQTAGMPVEIEGIPARRVRAIPVNNPGQPLLDAALRVADDCDALLIQDRLGVMRYRTKNFARPTRWTIPAHLVESTSIDMTLERGTVVNQVTVYYGEPDPATGNQLAVSEENQPSIAMLGERRADLYTDVMYEAGARGRAVDHLIKNRAAWEMPDVALVMNQATAAEADAVLDLQENWRIRIAPLPAGCPISEYDADIMGFTEIMHETDYRVILHLAPPFGEENDLPEEPIFDADSMTGGTVGQYEDQYGYLWKTHTFTVAGDFTLTCNKAVTGDALVVGGGGAGGNGNSSRGGGGGGGGAVFAGPLAFTPGAIPVTVGAGGVGVSGGTSKLSEVWCYGGGRGGNAQANGSNGGCGGGAGQDGGPGTATFGSLDGGVTTSPVIKGENGFSGSGRGGFGGGARYSTNITGSTVLYSERGAQSPGGQAGVGPNGATPGSGGGGGGVSSSPGGQGAAGIVVYRYRIG